CGLNYAMAQNPQIINISWGFSFILEEKTELMDVTLSKIFDRMMNEARSRNILVVAGIGNDSMQLTNSIKCYPASRVYAHENGLSVGALSYESAPPDLAMFSNYSSTADNYMTLAVPGENIRCAQPMYVQAAAAPALSPSGFQRKSGTSFAAPLVSRLAAMIISIHNYPEPHQVKNKLLSFTTKHYKSGSPDFGFQAVFPDSLKTNLCRSIKKPDIPGI
ncbi:MAG TPA: S8/S53 family peptidase, partial [Saprospiraceae bacterium]|nr:S8/S53 family peptidase [Saprospiraceae bacterium]